MRIETREDAVMLREVLEPIWSAYYAANNAPETVLSTNMCCRTAAMVAEIDPQWAVVHGSVEGQPHAWCQLDDGTVLDLTGDQFGRAAVIWGPLPHGYAVDTSDAGDCPGCALRPVVPVLTEQEAS
jgi:hypothetical protein